MKILLKSAKIIDPASSHHNLIKDILIENGQISNIANSIKAPERCKLITLDNLHVSTGWFDSSVSFGEPGFEERETLLNGLDVAAKSGFTAVALNANTNPVIDQKATVEFVIQKANGHVTNLHPIANVTQQAAGKELTEMYDMHQSGAIAFADYNLPIENANLMKVALQYAQNFDGLIMGFPQDISIAQHGFVNESVNTTKLGLKSAPELAESLRISRDLFLLEYTGGKLHIPTISTADSVKLIKKAKKKGLHVTCSVAVHHLAFTDEALNDFDTNFKVNPPLRSKKDVTALRKGLIDGTIDAIVTDHNPIDIENKKVEFEIAKYGSIGLESAFGVLNSIFEINEFIPALTSKAKAVFGLKTDTIEKGAVANLTLFNTDGQSEFKTSDIISKSKNSLFIGRSLKGKVYGVINNKQVVLA